MPSPAARIAALIILAIFMLPGPCLLVVTAVATIWNVIFISSSARTEGTIVALRQVPASRGRFSYAPIFQFTGDDEKTYTVTSNMAEKPSKFRFGQKVTVLYEHGHPDHAKIDSFLQLWLFELVAGIAGGGFSFIPAAVLLRRRRLARLEFAAPGRAAEMKAGPSRELR
jgi:Protein of unknown function (DUF3592)